MRKGQAAIEFLVTYGWAILIVLIAIGALAYFGVLNRVCRTDDCFQKHVRVEAANICDGINPSGDGLEYETDFFLRDLRALEASAPIFVIRDGETVLYDYSTDVVDDARFLIGVECHTPVLACARACIPKEVYGCMCYQLALRTYLNSTDLLAVGGVN